MVDRNPGKGNACIESIESRGLIQPGTITPGLGRYHHTQTHSSVRSRSVFGRYNAR